jgi:integrase
MQVVIDRYLGVRRLQSAPKTVTGIARGLRYFVEWLAGAYPQVVSLAEIRREHVAAFAEALQAQKSTRTGLPLVATSRRGILAPVAAFFHDTATWGWEGVPDHPLLMTGDFPRLPEHVPRFIPDDELARLMAAVRLLPCPYQRAALLIARWSGARRGEIRRLAVDCLDHYPDRERTWRLRIPAGKTYRERLVPLHDEAAEAIQAIQQLDPGARGFPDEKTGLETRYLFVRRGEQLSASYLFEDSLRAACQMAGLTAPDGRATITAHRFRHTVGTRLAESGARLQTIMKVLGHVSPQMALVYANISDREVLKDYAAVLGPGATIAGPMAATLRAGDLPAASVEWLKTNFLKTELELGHCLRLPEEGPCECDLYLSCAKFVTSREYAPRLRARRQRELMLVNDAVSRGWDREVERHRCTVQRLEQLLAELNEPLESPDSFE